ncbi:MAG TPA: LptA/OstA family protein [Candidatus Angelobacter sp.]
MPLNPRLLRRVFAAGAVIAVLVVSAFYLRGILRFNRVTGVPSIPSNVVQSTKGFTFSKSEGGRTIFVIHAAQAEQLKESGRAKLHDVNIVIYGRQSNRFDQIYGADFQYDPKTEDVVATGEVHIDLESNASGPAGPDQALPQEMKNPIHLKTSGLVFNRNTGLAATKELIEFRLPEASGSAVGATYDSHSNLLTLQSSVHLVTTEKHKATITAKSAIITKEPLKAVLQSGRVEEQARSVQADRITVLLHHDNTIDRVLGDGNVHVEDSSPKGFKLGAPQAEMLMAGKEQVRSGTLSGAVTFEARGASPAQGTARRLLLDFGPGNLLTRAQARDGVQLNQGTAGKSVQLQSDGLDFLMGKNKKLEKAVTSGTARVLVAQGNTKTVITADQFQGRFNALNRPTVMSGSSNVKTVSTTPGKADQITTSREVVATFNDQNAIEQIEQDGDFHYQQDQQTATADRARYVPADEVITLIGSPRVKDPASTLTAENIQLNRKTRVALAQRDVKVTYTDLKTQPNGGMLGAAGPIHVTGSSMTASPAGEQAKFTNARLWQSSNIVEAPVITFDRAHRSLLAQGSAQGRVSAVFIQQDKSGKSVPVNVTADRLSYVDAERKAVFSGNVVTKASETTITADTVQILLTARSNQGGSQLDRIIAQGEILIEQPNRKATGNQLVYTAADEKMVLTAEPGKRPAIVDAERGRISGDSLTFYRHDDRVLVDSKEASRTLIQTRIPDASKK